MASESPTGPVKAFRHEESEAVAAPLPTKTDHKAEGAKPLFSHPKSAPIRPIDESDSKKQHFAFLGNLMTAPESRESVIARQKQYFEELSRQVQEKKQVKETHEALNSSNRLSFELQTINEELRQERETLGRLRPKLDRDSQASGSALLGGLLQRDEGALIRKKKEEQQREIQDALRSQIEEKKRKKEEERQARIAEDMQQEKAIQEAQRKLREDFDRESGKSPAKVPPPDSPKESISQLFSTQTTIPPVPQSPKDRLQQEELERLNAQVQEMQKNNFELMEKLNEQNKLILQIRDQKQSREGAVPRPKPPLVRGGSNKDTRKVEDQKRKEKHEAENARIKAYELKIENARRKKEAMTHATRARQTSGLLRQLTYVPAERTSPMLVPRMQSAFAGGAVQTPEEPMQISKLQSSRVCFGSMDSSPIHHQDLRQNLDTAGTSEFIYPKPDGTFYPSGHDELDKLIESENQKLRKSPSIPDMAVSQTSQWVAVPRMELLGHQSQMSNLTSPENDLKVSRFPRDVFGRKRA